MDFGDFVSQMLNGWNGAVGTAAPDGTAAPAVNPGATAIPGQLDAAPNLADAVPPGGNQATAWALMQPPYSMTPGQLGQMQADAQNQAAQGTAVGKLAVQGASTAADKLIDGPWGSIVSSVIEGAADASGLTGPERQQQQADDLYQKRLNDSLALPLQNPNLDWRIRAFMP